MPLFQTPFCFLSIPLEQLNANNKCTKTNQEKAWTARMNNIMRISTFQVAEKYWLFSFLRRLEGLVRKARPGHACAVAKARRRLTFRRIALEWAEAALICCLFVVKRHEWSFCSQIRWVALCVKFRTWWMASSAFLFSSPILWMRINF